MVSASGDASLRLIYGKVVQPVNVNLIPDWKNFIPQLKSPPHNRSRASITGVSLQWGPKHAPLQHSEGEARPTSWSAIYSPKYKGEVTVPDNPIQIGGCRRSISRRRRRRSVSPTRMS